MKGFVSKLDRDLCIHVYTTCRSIQIQCNINFANNDLIPEVSSLIFQDFLFY